MPITPRLVPVTRVLIAFGAVLTVCLVLRYSASAAGPPPLSTEDIAPSPQEGFGDRNNSWAWSMYWWQNHLYVGMNRAYGCVSAQAYHALNSTFPYPPADPDESCTPDPGKLKLAAQIWSWDPATNQWSQMFTSAYSITNPSLQEPGLFLPWDIGFRTVAPYTDTVGVSHLIFGGVTSGAMGFGNVPPPRLLQTTDGSTYNPLPQDPGTFLGTLSNVSMRGLTDFNNQLFVINGNIQGAGPIIASLPGVDPLAGNDNWATASPPGVSYYNLTEFNGYLYAGVIDTLNGYSIVKTAATGTMPYTFSTIISNGGGLYPNPSQYPISFNVFNNRLYVGTVSPPELIRINADDTWDLVVGTPRQYNGQWKYPLSGIGEQYNNNFNDHIWRLGQHNGSLFAGTYDASIRYKNTQQYPQLLPELGFDLFRSEDGWHMTGISTTGMGNGFDYGVRNFADTPYGMFFGSANEYYGLTVFRGVDGPSNRVLSPQRVDVEVSHNQPVLSWNPVNTATSYHVWRAPFVTVTVTGNIYVPGGNFTFPGTFQDITGASGIPDTVFVDNTITSTLPTYEYYVTAQASSSAISDPSNIALAPSYWPPTTFTSLEAYITTLQTRGRFVNGASYQTALSTVQAAQTSVFANNDISTAFSQLATLDSAVTSGSIASSPDSTDLDITIAQLLRRLKLANAGLVDVSTLQ